MQSTTKDSVLNAIADDYESVATILETVRKFDEPEATAHDISQALEELVREGLAQTYELSPSPPHSKLVDFDVNRADELWFYVTSEGKNLVRGTRAVDSGFGPAC
ncbi:MAG: hypothetical protein WBW69_12880 [Candidatus Korobacteraceae bacterium]